MNNFEKDLSKEMAELTKDTISDVVRPSSKSIGENLGLAVDGVMGWIGLWGQKQKIKQDECLAKFKESCTQKLEQIPPENLIEPKTSLALPIIDASKYYYEEDYYRDLFSSLLVSSCDKKYVGRIHPSFPEIIKQLSSLDARFINCFKYNNTYPAVMVNEHHCKDGKITPFCKLIFDLKDQMQLFDPQSQLDLTASLDNLIRLGLVIKNSTILELNYDYDNFKKHPLYSTYSQTRENHENTLSFIKYRIELTQLGENFAACCYGK